MGRQNRVKSPEGTITRTVYTSPDRVKEIWVGTDDTDATDANPAGSGSPNNMVIVSANVYDNGSVGYDGNLTQVTQYADATDTRVTLFTYDWRNRRTVQDGEIDVYTQWTYDNLDRVTQVQRRNTTSTGYLIAREVTAYDNRGRVYRKTTYAVNPATGVVGNSLVSNTWYDAAGNVIKQVGAGSGIVFSKTVYNGAGWTTAQYTGYNTSNTWSTANSLSTDTITNQVEYTYDHAGNAISVANSDRLNDSTGTGALSAGTQPIARISYSATWYDGVDRTISNATYGAIASFTRPDVTPSRSDDVLVSNTYYSDAGRAYRQVDPKGIETQMQFDDAGRKIETIEAYGTGVARTTQYSYTLDNQISTLTAINSATGSQTTTYTYGTTLSDSDIARNNLLRTTAYPDSTGSSDVVAVTYNRLGQEKTRTDQRQTVRSFDYDKLGRLIHDRVTTVGSDTSSAVLRISKAYEVRGMVTTITSYDDPTVGSGTVLNEVKMEYNTFGQLVKESQEHSGLVTTSSLNVQYAYADGSSSSNQIRATGMTYPNGRVITRDYGTSGGLDDLLNRVNTIKDGTTTLAAYTYIGSGTVVRIDFTEPTVMLDLWGGTSGTFAGIDRFGRVIDQRWRYYVSKPAVDG